MKFTVDLIVQIFTFGIVALISVAIINGIVAALQVRRRLSEQTGDGAALNAAGSRELIKNGSIGNPVLNWVQTATLPEKSKDKAKLAKDLSLAGIDQPTAPAVYVMLRFGLAVGLPALFLFSQMLSAKPMSGPMLALITLGVCGVGLIAPRAILDRLVRGRKEAFEHQFPDALDLIVVCVEAGLGLDSAFVRVGTEVKRSHPRISMEFGMLSNELAAGRSRSDAMREMADRVGVDSFSSFVALVVQTESLGVSIGQTLRVYSSEMREHRFLKAEEKAMRIPVLMTIPLVVCFLPVIVTAVLLPAVIDLIRTVGPALNGHS
ncbi:MAG TPA: type II secretion system F family protein [Caulobacteraceae bacterium]|jgi:tight adherence protein C|nr:type II secretion system F family protein [Caulobacteraceae bacterium]